MNRIISFIALVCIPLLGISQKINQKDSEGRKHGLWGQTYKDSYVYKYQGNFNHGNPVDTFVYRYESGAISAVMVFSNKGKVARAKLYHETGYLMAKGKYINKLKDSLWIQFDSRGKFSYTDNWKNGKLHGEKVVYYETDKTTGKTLPAQVISYKNGLLDGPVKEYFQGGKIKMEANYKEDYFDGAVKKYHPNGKVSSVERWSHKVKHGWSIAYDEKGIEIGRKYFYKGKELKKAALKNKLEELKAAGKNPNSW